MSSGACSHLQEVFKLPCYLEKGGRSSIRLMNKLLGMKPVVFVLVTIETSAFQTMHIYEMKSVRLPCFFGTNIAQAYIEE